MTCAPILNSDGEVVGTICAPDPLAVRRRILDCPTCKRRRRFVVHSYEWYGSTFTCVGCGDAWSDGERHPRPFARGWRDRARARARREWDAVST